MTFDKYSKPFSTVIDTALYKICRTVINNTHAAQPFTHYSAATQIHPARILPPAAHYFAANQCATFNTYVGN